MKLQQQVEYWKAHAQHLEQTIADLEHYARLDKTIYCTAPMRAGRL
jgi:hypothetical protein